MVIAVSATGIAMNTPVAPIILITSKINYNDQFF